MERSRTLAAASALALILVTLPASAAAQAPSRQTLGLKFDTQRLNASAASTSIVDYVNPGSPGAKPFAVDRLRLVFHPGTRINTSVPPQCRATNGQLTSRGRGACPVRSVVGGGVVRLDTGFSGSSRYFVTDVSLINNSNQLIFLFEDRRSGRRFVSRAAVGVRSIDAPIPYLPGGAPDRQTAIDYSRLTTRAIANRRGRYLTTPGSCPASGAWTNRGYFTYDGLVQQEASRSACGR